MLATTNFTAQDLNSPKLDMDQILAILKGEQAPPEPKRNPKYQPDHPEVQHLINCILLPLDETAGFHPDIFLTLMASSANELVACLFDVVKAEVVEMPVTVAVLEPLPPDSFALFREIEKLVLNICPDHIKFTMSVLCSIFSSLLDDRSLLQNNVQLISECQHPDLDNQISEILKIAFTNIESHFHNRQLELAKTACPLEQVCRKLNLCVDSELLKSILRGEELPFYREGEQPTQKINPEKDMMLIMSMDFPPAAQHGKRSVMSLEMWADPQCDLFLCLNPKSKSNPAAERLLVKLMRINPATLDMILKIQFSLEAMHRDQPGLIPALRNQTCLHILSSPYRIYSIGLMNEQQRFNATIENVYLIERIVGVRGVLSRQKEYMANKLKSGPGIHLGYTQKALLTRLTNSGQPACEPDKGMNLLGLIEAPIDMDEFRAFNQDQRLDPERFSMVDLTVAICEDGWMYGHLTRTIDQSLNRYEFIGDWVRLQHWGEKVYPLLTEMLDTLTQQQFDDIQHIPDSWDVCEVVMTDLLSRPEDLSLASLNRRKRNAFIQKQIKQLNTKKFV